jgi:putative ABC transport system ATP-binding protein
MEPDGELAPRSMTVVLHASSLYRFYHVGDDEVFALRGVELAVRAGEFVAIVGPSGSGKSTLLRTLAGLEDPDGGRVDLNGRPLTRQPEADRTRRRAASIGLTLQTGNLFPHLTVLENIRLRQLLGVARQNQNPERLLDSVGLGHRGDALPATLSGGELARAGLAVALSIDPSVMLCDEPTAEVDQATEAVIIALFKRLQQYGAAILVATHSTVLAGSADRVLRIVDGTLQ